MANSLNKLNNFEGVQGPVLTIVMDGVGIAADNDGNAVKRAYTPTLDAIMAKYPVVKLKAHGTAVGLPSDDDMGNSEVGHNALGSGQVFAQGAKLVSNSIESKKMFESDTWKTLVTGVKTSGGALHFIGLFSDGNVHSHIDREFPSDCCLSSVVCGLNLTANSTSTGRRISLAPYWSTSCMILARGKAS